MEIRAKKMSNQHSWTTSLIVTAGFFLLFHLFCYPLYNSGDDAFFAYTLSGGYGETPTNLLHYNYGWHYWLGSLVRQLVIWFPGINMYSLLLLLFHFLGCTFISYTLFKSLKPGHALFFILTFFFFIESRQLLSLTYSGTAFVMAAGGAGLLVHQLQENNFKGRNSLLAIGILSLAGMLRLHISILVMLLFIPAALTLLKKKALLKAITVFTAITCSLILLNKLHEAYYEKNIPGWAQQENLRQALFITYNRPLKSEIPPDVFADSSERELFFTGYLYDTVLFNAGKVKEISKKIVRERLLDHNEDRRALYWFFIEMRIYLALFFVVLLRIYLEKKQALIKRWLWSFAAVMGVYAVLFIFRKIPLYIHCGLLMLLWQHLAMQFSREDDILRPVKPGVPVFSLLFFALVAWMGIRLFKQDQANRVNHEKFLCAVEEINRQPQKLFIATADIFPLDLISVWDHPSRFPARNLIYKDRLLTNMHKSTLEKFGVTSLDSSLRSDTNILLLGYPLMSLEKNAARILTPMGCLQVRKLR